MNKYTKRPSEEIINKVAIAITNMFNAFPKKPIFDFEKLCRIPIQKKQKKKQ